MVLGERSSGEELGRAEGEETGQKDTLCERRIHFQLKRKKK